MTVSQVLSLSFVAADTEVTVIDHYFEADSAATRIKTGTKTDSDITDFNSYTVERFSFTPAWNQLQIIIVENN